MYRKLLFAVLLILSILFISCARQMSDEDYVRITEEFTEEFVINLLYSNNFDNEEDIEVILYNLVDETSRKSGYTVRSYLRKANKEGDDWEDIWSKIELRMEQELQKIWNQSEEDMTFSE